MRLQEWAVRRVLAGQSSLIVAATGTGKSLCYQLPALLQAQGLVPPADSANARNCGDSGSSAHNDIGGSSTHTHSGSSGSGSSSDSGDSVNSPGITIVVSPLISLMRDQMLRLPRGLQGVALSGKSTQAADDVASVLTDLRDRRAHVLFVSPERLFSRAFQRLAAMPALMPRVATVVIDEAHVLCEWSHNFRPVYLRLPAFIHAVLRPRAILALTATATLSVVSAVATALAVPPTGVWVSSWRRSNLSFCASREEDPQAAAVALLKHIAACGLPKWVLEGEGGGSTGSSGKFDLSSGSGGGGGRSIENLAGGSGREGDDDDDAASIATAVAPASTAVAPASASTVIGEATVARGAGQRADNVIEFSDDDDDDEDVVAPSAPAAAAAPYAASTVRRFQPKSGAANASVAADVSDAISVHGNAPARLSASTSSSSAAARRGTAVPSQQQQLQMQEQQHQMQQQQQQQQQRDSRESASSAPPLPSRPPPPPLQQRKKSKRAPSQSSTSPQPPSTIVYVTTQADAERLANVLSAAGISAGAYHAGLGLVARDRVYSRFLSGTLRVVVATVAFGMGIDCPLVRIVVHVNLPRSIEDYVQQCGRAGRDGARGYCHAILDSAGEGGRRLHSLAAADGVERAQVCGLLRAAVLTTARALLASGRWSPSRVQQHQQQQRRGASQRSFGGGIDADSVVSTGTGSSDSSSSGAQVEVGGEGDDAAASAAVDDDDTSSMALLPQLDVALPLGTLQRLLNLRPEVTETLMCYVEAEATSSLLTDDDDPSVCGLSSSGDTTRTTTFAMASASSPSAELADGSTVPAAAALTSSVSHTRTRFGEAAAAMCDDSTAMSEGDGDSGAPHQRQQHAQRRLLLTVCASRYTVVTITFPHGVTPVSLAAELPLFVPIVAAARGWTRGTASSAPSASLSAKGNAATAAAAAAARSHAFSSLTVPALHPPPSVIKDDKGRVVLKMSVDDVVAAIGAAYADAARVAMCCNHTTDGGSSRSGGESAATFARRVSSAARTAESLRRALTAPGFMRELYLLQTSNRIAVSFSDWGLVLSPCDGGAIVAAAEAVLEIAHRLPLSSPQSSAAAVAAAAAASTVQRSSLLPPQSSTNPFSSTTAAAPPTTAALSDLPHALSPALERVASRLVLRMAGAVALSLSRLEAVHGLLRGASLVGGWRAAWGSTAVGEGVGSSSSTSSTSSSRSSSNSSSLARVERRSHGNNAAAAAAVSLVAGAPVAAQNGILAAIDEYLRSAASSVLDNASSSDASSSSSGHNASAVVTRGSSASSSHPASFSNGSSTALAPTAPAASPPSLLTKRIASKVLPALVTDVRAVIRRMTDILAPEGGSHGTSREQQQQHNGLAPPQQQRALSSRSSIACDDTVLISPLAITRVLHAVYSPVFPGADFRPLGVGGGWGGTSGLWGRYAEFDFGDVLAVAAGVLKHAREGAPS